MEESSKQKSRHFAQNFSSKFKCKTDTASQLHIYVIRIISLGFNWFYFLSGNWYGCKQEVQIRD